jgi:signal peptidase I
MQGTFRKGDVLLVTAIPPEKVRQGDVIAFRHTEPDNNTRLAVRRVHSCMPEGFITKGNRISYTGKIPVLTRDLINRVCFARRNGKELPVWASLQDKCRLPACA